MPIPPSDGYMVVLGGSPQLKESGGDELSGFEIAGGSLVVALRSSGCLSFSQTTDETRQRMTRNLLAYELEELLPVDGDDLAFDRVTSKSGGLIVAADGAQFVQTVDEIVDRGQYIAAITPLVFLALPPLQRASPLQAVDVLLWQTDEGIDFIRLDRGVPTQWRWSTLDAESVASSLSYLFHDDMSCDDVSKCKLLLVDTDPELRALLPANLPSETIGMKQSDAAAETSERIVRGIESPLFDLRNGPFESETPLRPIARAMTICVFSLLLIQAAVVVAARARVSALRKATELLAVEQEEAFRSVFPDEPIPIGVLSRMQSEHRRLAGTRGVAEENVPRLASAIPTAYRFMRALPEQSEAEYSIDRIEVSPKQLRRVVGDASSFEALETITGRLAAEGFDMPPVSASVSDEGVSLRLDDVSLTRGESP